MNTNSCFICERNLRVEPMQIENKKWCGGCEKGIKYISYPFGKQNYDRDEFVPAYPPWTTFNGVILCKENSKEGIILKSMDRNYDNGFYLDKNGNKKDMIGFIRGYWTSSKLPNDYYTY
jgi:hypothetical protein